jgi:hypothetical protein
VSDEHEETVPATEETTATSDAAREKSVDDRAESFLSLESEVRTTGADGVRGQAVDVERLPTSTVPDDYPITIDTPDALALTVALKDGTEVRTYFEFETGSADDRLSRLLAVHDIPADRFGDLHGEWLLLTVKDGHCLPVVPAEFPRGDGRAVYGIVAGLALNLLVGLLAAGRVTSIASLSVVVFVLVVNVVGLPVAAYVDGWHLRTKTDWGQWPAFWALLAVFPGLNVLTTAAYLWTRRRSTPLA